MIKLCTSVTITNRVNATFDCFSYFYDDRRLKWRPKSSREQRIAGRKEVT